MTALIAIGCWLLYGLIVALLTKRASILGWGRQLFIAADQLLNVLFFWQGNGSGHCERAYIAERERLQAPPETR